MSGGVQRFFEQQAIEEAVMTDSCMMSVPSGRWLLQHHIYCQDLPENSKTTPKRCRRCRRIMKQLRMAVASMPVTLQKSRTRYRVCTSLVLQVQMMRGFEFRHLEHSGSLPRVRGEKAGGHFRQVAKVGFSCNARWQHVHCRVFQ